MQSQRGSEDKAASVQNSASSGPESSSSSEFNRASAVDCSPVNEAPSASPTARSASPKSNASSSATQTKEGKSRRWSCAALASACTLLRNSAIRSANSIVLQRTTPSGSVGPSHRRSRPAPSTPGAALAARTTGRPSALSLPSGSGSSIAGSFSSVLADAAWSVRRIPVLARTQKRTMTASARIRSAQDGQARCKSPAHGG